MAPSRLSCAALLASLLLVPFGTTAWLQGPSGTARPQPLTVFSRQGRQTLAVSVADGREVVSLDDVSRLLELSVREDSAAGGITVSRQARTLVLSTTQGLASVDGRLVALSGPPVRSDRGWLVPLDVVGRAIPLVTEQRVELRRRSRLLLVGDVRVPHVAVRHEAGVARAQVTLEITPRTEHTVTQQARRLVVSFHADAVDAEIGVSGQSELLERARVDGLAIVLDLGPRFVSYRASDTPVERNGTRLVIDLMADPGAAPAGPAPTVPLAPDLPGPAALFDTPTLPIRTIVLDPGHGGTENGAKGPGGTLEKDVALSVARRLKAVLEARLGVRVLLTRDGDQTVALDERAAVANNNQADLFISLHANASVRDSVSGAEVFYLSLDGYAQDALAGTAEPGELLPTVSGSERQIDLILWEMAQTRHLEDSAVLASMIEEQLRGRVPMSVRAIQQAPFRVLVGANMPAALVEMGFITNTAEEKQLASPERQTEIVHALYEAIVRFRSFLEGGRRTAPATSAPAAGPVPATPVAGPPPPRGGAR